MTRLLLSCTAAAMLLLPVVTQAATPAAMPATTPAAPMATKPMATKPMASKPMKPAMRHMARMPVRRDPGSAAVDALNDQALARARGAPVTLKPGKTTRPTAQNP